MLALLAPVVLFGTCGVAIQMPGRADSNDLGMVIGLTGIVFGVSCVGGAFLLFQKTMRHSEELRRMEATGQERSVAAFHRQSIYRTRTMRHLACGGETELSGFSYYEVCDPFTFQTPTVRCGCCGQKVDLRECWWADTGETLDQYRQRLRATASWWTWVWRLGLIPLLGVGAGLLLLRQIGRKPDLVEAGLLVGLGFAFVTGGSGIATRLGWRQRRWAQP